MDPTGRPNWHAMKNPKRIKSSSSALSPSTLVGQWGQSAGSSVVESERDQTRLAAIQMVFTPEECSRLIADFTPHLKPASVEALDPTQSAGIRRSSAVFV